MKPQTEVQYQARIANLQEELAHKNKLLKTAVKKDGIFQALVDEMESVITPLTPLDSKYPSKIGRGKIQESMVLHLSDEHADEIVLRHQVGGLESVTFETMLCRAENLIDSILDWKSTLSNHVFPELYILANGDHTSGEIHGAKERSAYRNMFRNSLAVGQMHSLMVRDLAPHFKKVNYVGLSGNHGRRTTSKDFHGAHDNWDYLIHEIAKMHSSAIPNVDFYIPDCYSVNLDIRGWGFHVEHGDGIKSWMGIPWYGLERKTRRLVALHNTFDQKVSYFCFGHFHSLGSTADLKGEMLTNGCWAATNPYGYEEFSGYREPMQLLHGVHERRGVSWRLPIKIKDEKREQEGPRRYHVVLAEPEFTNPGQA